MCCAVLSHSVCGRVGCSVLKGWWLGLCRDSIWGSPSLRMVHWALYGLFTPHRSHQGGVEVLASLLQHVQLKKGWPKQV